MCSQHETRCQSISNTQTHTHHHSPPHPDGPNVICWISTFFLLIIFPHTEDYYIYMAGWNETFHLTCTIVVLLLTINKFINEFGAQSPSVSYFVIELNVTMRSGFEFLIFILSFYRRRCTGTGLRYDILAQSLSQLTRHIADRFICCHVNASRGTARVRGREKEWGNLIFHFILN